MTLFVFMPGQVMKWLRFIARSQVDLTGLNNERCKNLTMSALVVSCSKLKTKFSPSENDKYFVSPSEVVNGIFQSLEQLSRVPWRMIFHVYLYHMSVWKMLRCIRYHIVATESRGCFKVGI